MVAEPSLKSPTEQTQQGCSLTNILMHLLAFFIYVVIIRAGYYYAGWRGLLVSIVVGWPIAAILTVFCAFALACVFIILYAVFSPREFFHMIREETASSHTPEPDQLVEVLDHEPGYWNRRLGRIRLGVEPVEEQIERIRKMTWVIIVVVTFLELVFLSLFTGFGRPDIGFVVIVVSLVPIELYAWFDYRRLQGRVREYLAEVKGSTIKSEFPEIV